MLLSRLAFVCDVCPVSRRTARDDLQAVSECPVKQIPSGDIEELVRQQLQKMLSDITLIMRFAEKSCMTLFTIRE